jgi:multiple sugar transport system substrate-binding protein
VSAMKDPEVWQKGFGQAYYETVLKILEDAEPLARGPKAEEIIQVVGTELNAAVAGEKTAEQALKDAAAQVRKILGK